MAPRLSLELVLRVVLGSVWAGAMVVTGLWTMLADPAPWPVVAPVRWLVGPTLAAGGLFVFMVLVADRLFPRASRPMILMAEAGCFAAFVAGPLFLAWVLLFAKG